jgi:thiol-disulfide isomerase/thioredoxin
MKLSLLAGIVVCALLAPMDRLSAADAGTELKELIGKIQTKLKAGERSEKELAAELKEFDAILALHKGEKTDDVAQVLFMKAALYLEVFDNTDLGTKLLKQVKADYPNTKAGQNVDKVLASVEKTAEVNKVKNALKVGVKFPDFDEKDTSGKALSIAGFKGKVVLLDFWATWCGPCVAELPSVLKTYEKHHSNGFEIIGISLDQDQAKLSAFVKERKMAWVQYFDGKGWENKLAQKYGINSIPATYLLDGEGKIIAKDLRGEALEAAVAKALAKK